MGCIFCNNSKDVDEVEAHKSCKISDGHPCIPCQQYIELETQILAAQKTIAKMMLRQNELRTEINRYHDPLLRCFPPEILSTIFTSFTEQYGMDHLKETNWQSINRCPPLVLGAVCRDWRRVAWSSPQLWTHIKISLTDADDWNCTEIVQECLRRSGQLPLFIKMTCIPLNAEVGLDPEGVFLGLISVINQHSDQWEDLRLYCSPEIFPFIRGNSYGVPMLRRLALGLPDPWDPSEDIECNLFDITGSVKPQPLYVETYGISFESLDINWSQVTEVHFDTVICLNECIELLRQAPQLVNCAFLNVSDSRRVGYTFSTNNVPFVHHKLQSLVIGGYGGDKLVWFLGFFIFPNLGDLCLDEGCTNLDLDWFTDLITRSSCRLVSLSLVDLQCPYEKLLRLLRKTPFLRKLDLTYCVIIDRHPSEIFRLLADTSTSDASDGSQLESPFLPNVQFLQYYSDCHTWDASFWALIPGALGRWDIHDPQSRRLKEVYINIWEIHEETQRICVDRDVMLRLVEALQSGIKLNLKCNNHDILKPSIAHHQITIQSDRAV
ncbi:hypothetical protein CVT25_001608 [Psilocybe cyanescens]|uniref:Uncharacterized protein n=1 Tax=Psilocybe cyanescens TaxID=93625 RepID=A0A409WPY1_PSICY|nr:hypothetical protein CVT25_001608 [Psilocybe cyanescens]